jgi:hypothetical protein
MNFADTAYEKLTPLHCDEGVATRGRSAAGVQLFACSPGPTQRRCVVICQDKAGERGCSAKFSDDAGFVHRPRARIADDATQPLISDSIAR